MSSGERGGGKIASADEQPPNIIIKDDAQRHQKRQKPSKDHSIIYNKPFKIPKYTVPRQWNQVLERKYDMV